MFRRSPKEIRFRVRQELANLRMFVSPPELPHPAPHYEPLVELPNPAEALSFATPSFIAEIQQLADGFLAHRYPLLGYQIETGPDIEWRKDYVHGKQSEPRYFRRVPYLDFDAVGDHKVVWELNRHQHWITLGQAYRFTGNVAYRDCIFREIESWMEQNPFVRGINWASALEVAFRALSWIWTYHLIGDEMPNGLRRRFLKVLFQHGWFLEYNLSWYFSPNTHLLGELIACHAIGVAFPGFPDAERWRGFAPHIAELIRSQLADDGGFYEQSSYYHVYALDMYMFHLLFLGEVPDEYKSRLVKAARMLDAIMGPERELAAYGDDDGGRFFHPWGPKLQFGRATLATASVLLGVEGLRFQAEDLQPQAIWWLGRRVEKHGASTAKRGRAAGASAWFPASGVAAFEWASGRHLVFKPGAMGRHAGHSHADLNSIILRDGQEWLLIDPGTHNYIADLKWRNFFRSTAAHNTVRAGGRDQGLPRGPFHWQDPKPALIAADASEYDASGECEYGGLRHHRRVRIVENGSVVLVEDTVTAGGSALAEPLLIEQFWHLGEKAAILGPGSFQIGARARIHAPPGTSRDFEEGQEFGWRSPAYGILEAGFALRFSATAPLPAKFVTVIDLDGKFGSYPAELASNS